MDSQTLKEHVLNNSIRDGDRLRLTCERGHQLSSALNVDIRRIGEICQAEGIKIVHCQLGCFGEPRGR